MTLTATPTTIADSRSSLGRFRALNDARVPSTDPRRLAIAREMFPTLRAGAPLDDHRAAMRLLAALIRTP